MRVITLFLCQFLVRGIKSLLFALIRDECVRICAHNFFIFGIFIHNGEVMRRRKIFVTIVVKLSVVVAVVGAIVATVFGLPFLIKGDKKTNFGDAFIGKKAELQGVVELWHIDTFEGGSASRSGWISKRAIEFERENLGLYVLVKEVSESEFLLSLKKGIYPDLISFGSGLNSDFFNLLTPLNFDFEANNNAIKALKNGNGKTVAVPFCYSAYALFSFEDKFALLGLSGRLNENLTKTGYIKKLRRGEKKIYSCVYGGGGKTSPKQFLKFEQNELAVFPNCDEMTSYEAYCEFVSGKANILVGSLRDLARLENKVANGAATGLIVEPLGRQTNMACFLAAFNQSNALKSKYSNKFIEFCLSEKSQQRIKDIGLLSPIVSNLYGNSGNLSVIERAMIV